MSLESAPRTVATLMHRKLLHIRWIVTGYMWCAPGASFLHDISLRTGTALRKASASAQCNRALLALY